MSGIDGDWAALDEAIARLAALGDGVGGRIASAASPKLEAVARAQWAAGVGPDGAAWPANRDGGVPIVALTQQITVEADGDTVVMSGPEELRPHFAKRPVWPAPGQDGPAEWERPFEDAAREEIDHE